MTPFCNGELQTEFVSCICLRNRPIIPIGGGRVEHDPGYEGMSIIRKGQIRRLPKTDVVGQARFIERVLGIAK